MCSYFNFFVARYGSLNEAKIKDELKSRNLTFVLPNWFEGEVKVPVFIGHLHIVWLLI